MTASTSSVRDVRSTEPDADTLRWQALDRAHLLHPFTEHTGLHAAGTRVMRHARGVYVWDSDGRRFIDSMSGLWCVNVGYARRELADAAHRQMSELAYYNSFFNTANVPAIELSARLSQLAPAGLDHVFFATSGSEANETNLKIVRYYWNIRGRPTKKLILAQDYAYHGVTLATASISGLTDMHPQADLPLSDLVVRVPAPYWYRHGGDLSPAAHGEAVAAEVERRILEVGPENIGAFIGEPVYGAGGVMVPPETYWPAINRICRKYEILLIADEVVCGFGRTGRWFGSQTFGIEPDLMTVAKGLSSGYLPISASIVHGRIAAALVEHGQEWVHGFTYSAHPTACAVALENLAIIEREDLVERVASDIGPYFQQCLGSLRDHPFVGETRGVGLIAGVELVADKAARRPFDPALKVGPRCRAHCLENGLIMRAARDSMMAAPPLIITRAEVDEIVDKLGKALAATWAEVSEYADRGARA